MRHQRACGTAALTVAAMVVVGQPAMAWDIEDGAPAQLVVRDAATLSPADNVLRLELLDLGYRLSVVDARR